MNFIYTTLIALSLMATTSNADEHRLTTDMRSHDMSETYKFDSTLGKFTKTQYSATTDQEIDGTGIFAESTSKSSETDTFVPGLNGKSGHAYLMLETGDDKIVRVVIDEQIDSENATRKEPYVIKYAAPIEFNKGSFQEFTDGKEVEFKVTDEGNKIILGVLSAAIKKEFDYMTTVLLPNLSSTSITMRYAIEKLDRPSVQIYKGNIDRLEARGEEIKLRYQITASTTVLAN